MMSFCSPSNRHQHRKNKNMKILITGGSSGIGASIAEHFCQKSPENRVTVLDQAESKTKGVKSILIDLLKSQNVEDFNQQTDLYDVVINSAGMREIKTPHDLSNDEWRQVIELNLTVPFMIAIRQIQKALNANKKLSIINIGSISGLQAEPDRCAYVSSKFGLIGLTKQLAFQYGKYGIRTNVICPGVIETPMTASYFQDPVLVEKIKKSTPVGHWGQTFHIVPLIDLCIDNEYLNGSTLVCDGGWTAGKDL